jgi:hypothetical protein
MTLYPHEIVIRDFKRYFIDTEVIKDSLIYAAFGMLAVSTAITTYLSLSLYSHPEVIDGVLAGVAIMAIISVSLFIQLEDSDLPWN